MVVSRGETGWRIFLRFTKHSDVLEERACHAQPVYMPPLLSSPFVDRGGDFLRTSQEGVGRPVARIDRSNVAGGGGSGCRSSTPQISSSFRRVLVCFMICEFCRRAAPKSGRSTDCLGPACAMREGFAFHKVVCDVREVERLFIERSGVDRGPAPNGGDAERIREPDEGVKDACTDTAHLPGCSREHLGMHGEEIHEEMVAPTPSAKAASKHRRGGMPRRFGDQQKADFGVGIRPDGTPEMGQTGRGVAALYSLLKSR